MTAPGRNAPCPCGSGRKHKHCCLRKQELRLPRYTQQDRTSAFAKLMRYARRADLGDAMRLGWELFWGGRLDMEPGWSHRDTLENDAQSQAAFMHWLLLDEPQDPDGRTIADRFVERHGASLTPGERIYLDRMRASALRPYEVAEVRAEEGLRLRDLWTDDVVEVRERSATRQLARWDLFAARVIEGPHGWNEIDGIPYLYPQHAKADLMTAVRRHHARLRRELPADDPAAFFKRIGMVFHHFWVDYVAAPPAPRIVTAEGDPLALGKVVFDVTDRAAVTSALERHPEMDPQDDGSYVWFEPAGADQRRGLATVVPKGGRLVVEVTSEARADRARAFVEGLLGPAVRYRTTAFESLASVMSKPPPRPRKEDAIPAEVQQEIVGRYYEEHYRKWLDEPIPALGNRTPRHAARLKTVRPALVDLIKGLENQMERAQLNGQPAVDVGWMWAALGLERPG
jgi:hypothetical protein